MRPPAARVAAAVAVGAGTATALQVLLRARPPGGAPRWRRSNYRGRTVDLGGGPAMVTGAVAGALVSAPHPLAALAAGAGAGAVGLYDDLAGGTHARGFRGHLAALRRGQVTSGLVKVVGVGAAGVAASALGGQRSPVDVLLEGALVAGSANLLNLFDLRPGRALKVAMLAAVPVVGTRPEGAAYLAGPLGAVLAVFPADIGEQTMVGDAGANALGALVGLAAAAGRPRRARSVLLACVVSLTAVSELVSFSTVIERVPLLRAIDRWGRPAEGR